MKRLVDWRSRLSAVIEARRRQPYDERKNCAVFVVDCIEAMTGEDIGAPYRGRFETIEEIVTLIRADGYADMPDFIGNFLEEIQPVQARAGDVMLFAAERTGWAGGIVNGERVTVVSYRGLGTISRDRAVRAFRIP